MFNIFNSLKVYAEKWQVKEEKPFNDAELASIEGNGKVVISNYGNSVQFTLKGGGHVYIPLSVDANANVGDEINPADVTIITLSKTGEEDIHRVMV